MCWRSTVLLACVVTVTRSLAEAHTAGKLGPARRLSLRHGSHKMSVGQRHSVGRAAISEYEPHRRETLLALDDRVALPRVRLRRVRRDDGSARLGSFDGRAAPPPRCALRQSRRLPPPPTQSRLHRQEICTMTHCGARVARASDTLADGTNIAHTRSSSSCGVQLEQVGRRRRDDSRVEGQSAQSETTAAATLSQHRHH